MTRLDEISKLVGEISLKYQSRDSGGETEIDLFAVVGAFYELEKEKDKQLAEAGEMLTEDIEEMATIRSSMIDTGRRAGLGLLTKRFERKNKWLQEQRKEQAHIN